MTAIILFTNTNIKKFLKPSLESNHTFLSEFLYNLSRLSNLKNKKESREKGKTAVHDTPSGL